ncbi:MAG: hypothetical protein LKK39_08175 [Oscillospiraceae bacterium]|jgi:ESS family glutamate:Na+ symporter|nr:hypothetical protein [Oscillospiraceae bacterium]MCI2190898.1 hypothetical protein [Oscillospiraceae bacterium]
MEFSATTLFYDFAIMSALLFIANILRTKLKFLQNWYIPSSLVAGILGVIGGKYFMNVLPLSSSISVYPSIMISVLFGTLLIGRRQKTKFKETIKSVGDTFAVTTSGIMIQWGVGIAASLILAATIFPDLNPGFGMLMASGFEGGHGTAAAVGAALSEGCGWTSATSIGQTFATIGMLMGIFIGILLINIGTRKKWTRLIKEVSGLSQEMKTGLVEEKNQKSVGKATVNSISIDPLAWHLCIILAAVGGAYLLNNVLKSIWPAFSVPTYGIALICGWLMNKLLRAVKLDRYVDQQLITRIGSCVTDYLVGFGVASINISVVISYAVPLIIISLLGLACCLIWLLVVSRRIFHNYWFERGIYIFGMCTGVMAIGVILYRISDPDYKAPVLEDVGVAGIFTTFVDMFQVSMIPIMFMSGQLIPAMIIWLIVPLVIVAVSAGIYKWKKGTGAELRPGEEDSAVNYKGILKGTESPAVVIKGTSAEEL